MSPRLVGLDDATRQLARLIERRWADCVLSELAHDPAAPFTVPLHPGITTPAHQRRVGFDAWQRWAEAWTLAEPTLGEGVTLRRGSQPDPSAPHELDVADIDAAVRLLKAHHPELLTIDLEHCRTLAAGLYTRGVPVTPSTLTRMARLTTADALTVLEAVAWLAEDPDVAGFSERQLAIPGMHTKWLSSHGVLLRDVLGYDVRERVRQRPAVAHVTYVDPDYLVGSGRRHDAWTTGDVHQLPYTPRTVIIVENRDCRLWFPPFADAVVVEGGGRAATRLLAEVAWIRAADRVVYWGDLDADGLEILNHLRGALGSPSEAGPARSVASVLMDDSTLHQFARLGVTRDRRGRDLQRAAGDVPHLNEPERSAYYELTTSGPASVRRIEQEKLPAGLAARLIRQLP